MSENIYFSRLLFNPEQYKNTIDTQFTELSQVAPITTGSAALPDINDFFLQYNNIFYNIPISGITNSHEYLIQQSAAYVGLDISPDNIQDLIDEITELKQENLELQLQIQEISNILTPDSNV
jgi:hypothetical protein